MRTSLIPILLFGLTATGCDASPSDRGTEPSAAPAPAIPQPLTIRADDGVTIHALHYPAPAPKALILLFHQAGSNKAEYANIAPRLAQSGYSALAIDQRSGGDMFGGRNATVAALGRSVDYDAAEADLVAALEWAQSWKLPVVLWGSSYSASLVLPVAAARPGKVAGVLSFSPGEYLGTGDPVRMAAARVLAPVFVTSSGDSAEVAAAEPIFQAVPSAAKTHFIPERTGRHGSSTLDPGRNSRAEETWRAVLAFLDRTIS